MQDLLDREQEIQQTTMTSETAEAIWAHCIVYCALSVKVNRRSGLDPELMGSYP